MVAVLCIAVCDFDVIRTRDDDACCVVNVMWYVMRVFGVCVVH